MTSYRRFSLAKASLGLSCFLLALPDARAQALPPGDGILGEYYRGAKFNKLILKRRDATIAFDWQQRPPASGMPTEHFSVRWTGWLVPPVSGRYIFHASVDDGIRIWLNEELIMDEWRPQPVRDFTAVVDLTADKPYQLRVEYFQDILDTRAIVTWVRPDEPLRGWGIYRTRPQPIPADFLYSARPEPAPPVATAPPAPAPPAADSARITRVTDLAKGESLTMPELYFDQGQDKLLPPVQTALDSLAATLRARPALRFEVQGHTDNVGHPELNRQLSQRRADAVCHYLTTQGVAADRLQPKGYGSTQPVANNAIAARRYLNRRVVLRRL